MHSDTYNEMMTARAEGEPEPEPTLIVQAQAAEVDSPLIVPAGAEDDITHYVGDDCPGGHFDDPALDPEHELSADCWCEPEVVSVDADPYLLSPPPPKVEEVAPDGSTVYVRNGVRIAFPGDHTADEVEEAFRGAGF